MRHQYQSPKGRIFYRCVDWNSPFFTLKGITKLSHLLQMRGLKLVTMYAKVNNIGRIFYRCVDWNVISDKTIISLFSRIFYRCVDWNLKSKNNRSFRTRRIFYRCVDWNVNLKVRPCFLYKSHLLQMRGLKQAHEVGKDLNTGRIFYRCVDWNRNMFYNI